MTATRSEVRWDGYTAEQIARRCGIPRVELLTTTTSTLDIAHVRAEGGAPAGTLVLADEQTAGRGRLGRSWSSQPGRGVWATIVERPHDRGALEVLSLRVGLHLAESLDALAGERVGVKWPNDLVLRTGKLAGILVEARWSGARPGWVAIGVGVNVFPPPDVEGAAGLVDVARVQVLEVLARAVRAAAAVEGRLSPAEIGRFALRDALAGCDVASPAIGVVAGIDASGAIIINTNDGAELHRAGTIRFAEDS